jgi:hypothetical protein
MLLLFHTFVLPALAAPSLFGIIETTSTALQTKLGHISKLVSHLVFSKLAEDHPLKPLESQIVNSICRIIGIDPAKAASRKSKALVPDVAVIRSKPQNVKAEKADELGVDYFTVAEFIINNSAKLSDVADQDNYALEADTSVILQKYAVVSHSLNTVLT